jgi:hypothetical protein
LSIVKWQGKKLTDDEEVRGWTSFSACCPSSWSNRRFLTNSFFDDETEVLGLSDAAKTGGVDAVIVIVTLPLPILCRQESQPD